MRSILLGTLLVLQFLSRTAAQSGGNQFSCYQYFGMGMEYLATASADSSMLCASTGSLWSLMGSAQACMGSIVTSVPIPPFTPLNTVFALCNSEISVSSVSACQSLSSQHEACTAQVSYFGQPPLTPTTAGSATSSSAASPASTASQKATSTNTSSASTTQTSMSGSSAASTQTGAAANDGSHGPSVGLIAGIAIASALGSVILVGFFVIFIWRYRKQRKQKALGIFNSPGSPPPPNYEAKVQHLELESPSSSRKQPIHEKQSTRVLGGLQEMEGSNVKNNRLSVQEMGSSDADSGMRTWFSSDPSTDGLIDHHGQSAV